MKLKLKVPNKKQAIIGGALLMVVMAIPVKAAMNGNKAGANEKPPIVVEVEHQGEVLDNHEDRIDNLEKDVTVLQDNTSAPTSTERVTVREVTKPSATQPLESSFTPGQSQTPSNQSQPTPHARTITEAVSVPNASKPSLVTCRYKLYNQAQYPGWLDVVQSSSVACLSVGQVLPNY
jgi:hypothetical protein